MNRSLLAVIILFVPCLMEAAPADFSVTIVGVTQFQEHQSYEKLAGKDKGLPAIAVPIQADSKEGARPTVAQFYVVIRNVSRKPIRLDFSADDWYGCLEFRVTSADRKVFTIIKGRDDLPSVANPSADWIFQPGGLRVFPVNFTTERWEGLPPSGHDLPRDRSFKIKATFKFYDGRQRKERRFDSDTIDVWPFFQ